MGTLPVFDTEKPGEVLADMIGLIVLYVTYTPISWNATVAPIATANTVSIVFLSIDKREKNTMRSKILLRAAMKMNGSAHWSPPAPHIERGEEYTTL